MEITKDNWQEHIGSQVEGFVEEDGEWDGGGVLKHRCENSGLFILLSDNVHWSYAKIRTLEGEAMSYIPKSGDTVIVKHKVGKLRCTTRGVYQYECFVMTNQFGLVEATEILPNK